MESTENTAAAPAALDKAGFFSRCEEIGVPPSRISAEFKVSSQTIRNWRKKDDAEEMPAWVSLACIAIAAVKDGKASADDVGAVTVAGLSEWQARHGFRTYADTAAVFSIKRQAVHNWYKRQRFPKWLGLACAGYDLWVESLDDKNPAATA